MSPLAHAANPKHLDGLANLFPNLGRLSRGDYIYNIGTENGIFPCTSASGDLSLSINWSICPFQCKSMSSIPTFTLSLQK
jgi:hypothetical protein